MLRIHEIYDIEELVKTNPLNLNGGRVGTNMVNLLWTVAIFAKVNEIHPLFLLLFDANFHFPNQLRIQIQICSTLMSPKIVIMIVLTVYTTKVYPNPSF